MVEKAAVTPEHQDPRGPGGACALTEISTAPGQEGQRFHLCPSSPGLSSPSQGMGILGNCWAVGCVWWAKAQMVSNIPGETPGNGQTDRARSRWDHCWSCWKLLARLGQDFALGVLEICG